jgi:hypothetical protein
MPQQNFALDWNPFSNLVKNDAADMENPVIR